jgi:methionine-rich copper-binding protein CopC
LLSVTTTDVVTASTLSRDRTFDRTWEGDIAEVLVYNRALSAVESEQVGGYLTAKYGMTTTYGPPVISTYSPADNATGVAVGADLVATFSEPIAKGTGNITIRNLTDGTAANIAVTDAQVTVSGATLTINPTANLVAGKNYAIQIAATAIDDLAGNSFAGITNDTAWNFGTVNPYETWATTNAPGNDPDGDFDLDGVPNAIEFVLGGDKNTKDLGKLPAATTDSGNMTFTFVRDRDSVDPSVSVKIEVGTALGTWPNVFTVGGNTAGSSAGVTVSDNGNGTDTITLTVPQTPDTKKFARLKVAITK